MIHERIAAAWAGLAKLVLMPTTVILLLISVGCSSGNRAPEPASSASPAAPDAGTEVVGTLVALKDDRPVDGGIDLTLETAAGIRELARVPSVFRPQRNDSIFAMHAVVDSSKLGDRLRALGTRDESGALLVQVLEWLGR